MNIVGIAWTTELATCPCGKTPTELNITDAGQGRKWANVAGNCCGEWMIEFRTHYTEFRSEECVQLAREAWNAAPRAANAGLCSALMALRDARKWVQQAHDEAEAKHDNYDMDIVQYEIMRETEQLLTRIDSALL